MTAHKYGGDLLIGSLAALTGSSIARNHKKVNTHKKIYDLIPTSLLMQKIYKCHTNTLVLARTESTNTDIVSITQTHLCSGTDKKS